MNRAPPHPVWLEWCDSCQRKHYTMMRKCTSCFVYETAQPVSDNVPCACTRKYECDGCDAYRDHINPY